MLEYLLFVILFFFGLSGLFLSRCNLFLLLMAMDITFLGLVILPLYDDLIGTILELVLLNTYLILVLIGLLELVVLFCCILLTYFCTGFFTRGVSGNFYRLGYVHIDYL